MVRRVDISTGGAGVVPRTVRGQKQAQYIPKFFPKRVFLMPLFVFLLGRPVM
jgi:hypothetical protein